MIRPRVFFARKFCDARDFRAAWDTGPDWVNLRLSEEASDLRQFFESNVLAMEVQNLSLPEQVENSVERLVCQRAPELQASNG